MVQYNLDGKVVLITGAGGGIGLATARAFVAEGASVVGGDLDPEALESLGSDQVLPVRADLRDRDGAGHLVRAALERFGRVDVLHNNAGVAAVRPEGFLGVDDDAWRASLDLNLLGYVRMARAVLPHMLERGHGVLLHTASEAARMPNPRLPDYSVTKAGILSLSKALAREFTPRGVRSNVISPGFIRTAIYDRPGGLADALAEEFGTDRETALKRYVELNGIPAGRLGSPEEVASTAVYLASDLSGFISGAEIVVDGGVTPTV
ncbi:SDR family NAD(P)-dependent oxidoreductase [Kitasatospora sp. NPDC056783]|uniref:SDR family NAD(P)-dependent oxidoreductase n=1 Tax=Kitasatospora sp. NPDC056783 TaxID=3345943 RepID=UPI0036CC4EAF